MSDDETELREQVTEGWMFYAAPYLLEDSTVTDADATLDTVRDDPRFAPSDQAWAFESEDPDDTEWLHYVEPTEGGPNDGIVYAFYRVDGTLGGPHQLYPRAYTGVDQ